MTRARGRKASAPDDPGVSEATNVVAFGTPPSSGKNQYDWPSIREALRAKPGEWACVFEGGKRSVATAVRQGSVRSMSAEHGFRVKTAHNDLSAAPPTCDLWMQYVPDLDKHDPVNTNSRKKATKK